MGSVHTSKDQQVHMSHVEEMARTHDLHMSMLAKILRLGEGHGHKARFRESYLGGEHPASMGLELAKKATSKKAAHIDSQAAEQLITCTFVDNGGAATESSIQQPPIISYL